ITLDEAVQFVIGCLERMGGGEVFVPKIPSMRVSDIAEVMAPEAERRGVGIRAGEKLHGGLVTSDEARHAFDAGTHYTILPEYPAWELRIPEDAERCPDGSSYSSDGNDEWVTVERLREITVACRRQRDGLPSLRPAEHLRRGCGRCRVRSPRAHDHPGP